MARSIATIQNQMIADIKADPILADLTSTSATAIWLLMTYIFASAIWLLEKIFEQFTSNTNTALLNETAHRPMWYKRKLLAFQKGYILPIDSDVYDVIDPTAQVVNYAAAVELPDSSVLQLKIASDASGMRNPVDAATQTQVNEYVRRIKDAGVRFTLINQAPDYFTCLIDIYYNATLAVDSIKTAAHAAIVEYIENIPFNGEYSNMALIDALQAVTGIEVAQLNAAQSHPAVPGSIFHPLNALLVPDAGYLRAYNDDPDTGDITLNMIAHEIANN